MRRAVFLALLAACGSRTTGPTTPEPELDGDEQPTLQPGFAVPEPILGLPLYVRDTEGLALFSAEQAEAATIVAQWAHGVGFRVDEPARTREIFARASLGQDVKTGDACGAPLWSFVAADRWRVELHAQGRIEPAIECGNECRFTLRISEGVDGLARDAGRTALWTAPWDPQQPWRDELKKRLHELKLVPTVEKGPRKSFDERIPGAVETKTEACLLEAGQIGILFETNAQGAIAKCESYAEELRGDAPATACACKALMGAELGGGARRRTTKIALVDDKAHTASGAQIEADIGPQTKATVVDAGGASHVVEPDRSVREWEPPPPWLLARCFDKRSDVNEVTARIAFKVASPQGKIVDTSFTPLSGTLAPESQQCVAKVLREHARIPCPDKGIHPLEAELHIRLLQQP
ncbi:MAG TPA: hypothetical protein VGM90_07330 [Kofleriaceae bacterium]|jgi:hypothetical protein